MSAAQICAIVIFVIMFVLIVTEKIEKHYVTLVSGVIVMIVVFGICMRSFDAVWETLNIRSIFTGQFWYTGGAEAEPAPGINWATIIFLCGMMIMVEGMAHSGFFRWLCMRLAQIVKYKPIPLFVVFMIMSAILSMFIDSITVILFLAAVTIELAKLLHLDPVPMILSEIFCANLGGSATMCGDPPNIIIGTALGYSFTDFLMHTGVIAGVCLVVVIFYYFMIFRKKLLAEEHMELDISKLPDPASCIENIHDFTVSTFVFGIAVVLLITHASTGLTVAFIGVIVAGLTLLLNRRHVFTILKGVDYKTLLFFIGLFVVVGGLEQTGVLNLIANLIAKASSGNVYLMVAIIIWVSAIASAFVDNIPFAATMVPVIIALAASENVDLSVLAWALSMGTDIGGSATPIGASANVVGVAAANKAGYKIGWGKYCASSGPAMIIVVTISMLFIFVRYVGF